jgi:choline dehydrogenase-like flavoprotein
VFVDGRTIPDGETIRTQVCIVGAGPIGLVLAREMSEAGRDLVVLERGDAERIGPFTGADTFVNVGLPYPIDEQRAFGFGGSSEEWHAETPLGLMGRMRELDAEDFERRDWIPCSGWPFGKEAVVDGFRRARMLFDPSEAGLRSNDEWDERLADGVIARAPGNFVQRSFTFADPSAFVTRSRQLLDHREHVLVVTNAAVTHVEVEGDVVRSVAIKTSEGASSVTADVFVLAAGGLETPRILLCSGGDGTRSLGNAHDLVGRYFMEHPHFTSGLIEPRDRQLLRPREQHSIHLHDSVPVQRKYSLPETVVRSEGLPRTVFHLWPTPLTPRLRLLGRGADGQTAIIRAVALRRNLNRPVSRETRDAAADVGRALPTVARYASWKATYAVATRRSLDRIVDDHRAYRTFVMAEQVPNPASRVTLTARRDHLGVPVAALDWRLTDQDLTGLARVQELMAERLAAYGTTYTFVEPESPPPGLIGGAHHMGTARMHDSPRHGVVDRDGRVHGIANLFVAGSAVFPTVGYANPALTSLALAFRLSDHLRQRH